jgi:hypothetical protein
VLIVGGGNDDAQNITSSAALASAELYDPQSGSFAPTGGMASPRRGHTATLLDNGLVLVAGGANVAPLATTELYDPATGRFSTGANMATARTNHTATLLNDATVLMIGGIPQVSAVYNGFTPTSTAEIYDPASGAFSPTRSMGDGRYWHSAVLLNDGRVLVVGGGHSDAPFCCSDSVWTAETYP